MSSDVRRPAPLQLWRQVTLLVALLLAIVLAHDIDHLVTEDRIGGLDAPFYAFLPFQYGAFALVLVLLARRDARAPLLAALLCGLSILGFVGAHLVPFGPLPYQDYDLPAASWALTLIPLPVALLGLVAALRLRALAGGPSSATPAPAA